MEKKLTKQIEKLLKEFFAKATIETKFTINVVEKKEEPGVISIQLNNEEPYLLIGKEGKTLDALQMLLRRMIDKQLKEEQSYIINVDVNNYKESKEQYLKEIAREAANQVALSGKEKEFSPMAAFERRIIHTVLSDREDVETESRGEGIERCVVVKPK